MLQDRLCLSERRACQIAGQHRSTQRHEPNTAADDAALRARLAGLSRERPRWGYRRAHARLLEEGWALNRKRVQRLWREEGLRVPVRRRKRRRLGESTVPADRLRAERPDHVWALDFQFDQTSDGRILKLLHIVDEHTREALAIRCARRIDSDQTVSVLEHLVTVRGRAPEHIRCDNGRADGERPARLVSVLEGRGELHRAGLALAESLRRVLRLAGPRRAALRGALRDARRGAGAGRGLARRLQRKPSPLGAWHDGSGPLRRQLAAKRPTDQTTLIGGGPMRGVRSHLLATLGAAGRRTVEDATTRIARSRGSELLRIVAGR